MLFRRFTIGIPGKDYVLEKEIKMPIIKGSRPEFACDKSFLSLTLSSLWLLPTPQEACFEYNCTIALFSITAGVTIP
jgi:hypothetical protein